MNVTATDLEFRQLTKRYGDVTAVQGIDLAVPQGAFLAILGPSGCGKTTCLRMIGGFEQPSEGQVLIAGQVVNGIPAYHRPVNMVFQHYALFPHMNVAENVGYGLRQLRPRLPAAEIDRRVAEALEMVRLGAFAKRRAHEMSGGQQQRVALARAIVNRPKVLLLDEPLAALDKKLRGEMQLELLTLQRELGITFVLVTHDQEEALSMADLVCVMSAGKIRQLGAPQAVYDRPADLFVADFVGKMNRFEVTGRDGVLRLADGSALPGPPTNGPAIAALRPEAIRLSRMGEGLRGTVTHRIFLGASAEYAVELPGLGPVLVTTDRSTSELIEPGEAVTLSYDPAAVLVFPR
ncbi:ABC transporter ATP-binding protein [Stagnihabitans tardus]|uniref:ATP-binding cassette domain-containing protein n=1 Tax=Stagnihabitans tardus TaxID=2699202 RepID=A0AAE4Y9P3_9RHOB|nr:ABC transporter ATP-binding protein [Stagnihabitans tardus]NBZ88561.1 ATP-binding cassette domain-containing protein [Stagnihabitans tardus]